MFDIGGIIRYVGVYSKQADKDGEYELVKELELSPISLADLQKIFNVDPNEDDSAMVCFYDIDEKKARLLQPYVNEKMNLEKYDYMLGCGSIE